MTWIEEQVWDGAWEHLVDLLREEGYLAEDQDLEGVV